MKYNPTLHKLPNGVAVILDPMDTETTSVKISFKTGSRDEKPHEHGLTHFCEHMLCKGTARFPTRRDIADFLEDNGGNANAFTSPNELQFYGRIIGDNLDKLIDVLSDELQNSRFDSERIELERIVILDELHRAQDKPERKQTDFISRTLLGSSLYSYQTLGTERNIKSFTRQQMLDWLAQRLSAKNCTIVISGKIPNRAMLLQQLTERFAFLPTHDVPENTEFNYRQSIAHHSSRNTKNVNIFIAIPSRYGMTDKERFERMCEIRFKKYLREEIYEELRQRNGLVYGINMGKIGNEQGMHYIETECVPENVARVTELIAKTCAHIYNDFPLTDNWLHRYEAGCLLGDADWLDSPGDRSNILLMEYRNSAQLYDWYGACEMSKSITASDVKQHSRGFFDAPISIITDGPNYSADLGAIWKQNFPDSNIITNLINNIKTQNGGR